jgi:hypothetical protein
MPIELYGLGLKNLIQIVLNEGSLIGTIAICTLDVLNQCSKKKQRSDSSPQNVGWYSLNTNS